MTDSPRQLALDLPHATAMGKHDFVRSPSNSLAATALDAWPDWPIAAQGLRGFAMHGPSGSGKTHLAAIWRDRTDAAWLSARSLDGAADFVGTAPAVVCDGLDGTWNLTSAGEEALFHLYNGLAAREGFLLITGDVPPARLRILLPDLASRLGTLTTLALSWPDDALMEALLVKLFADRQLRVGAGVIPYLISRIERTPDAAARCVRELDRTSLAGRRAITVSLAREILVPPDRG